MLCALSKSRDGWMHYYSSATWYMLSTREQVEFYARRHSANCSLLSTRKYSTWQRRYHSVVHDESNDLIAIRAPSTRQQHEIAREMWPSFAYRHSTVPALWKTRRAPRKSTRLRAQPTMTIVVHSANRAGCCLHPLSNFELRIRRRETRRNQELRAAERNGFSRRVT